MPVTLTYHGHSAFGLSDGSSSVLIDPWFTGNPAATVAAKDVTADTILITHAHDDHVGDALSIAKRTKATVITVNELGVYLQSQGLKDVVPGNHGGTIAFKGGTAKFTQAWHSSSLGVGDDRVAPGVPAGFIVRYGGLVIYFAGDTALFGDMALIGEEGLDIAVLPIGDRFTMGPSDAVRAAKLLKAKTVIPCHYNTFPPIEQDANSFAKALVGSTSSTAVIMKPGQSQTFEP
jgi:L-ascorbate metabolism protein UlaG (beta-lactamase superfamily)